MLKHIYEHLKTRKKYNTKCIEVEVLKEDIAHLNILMKEKDDAFKIKKEIWEKKLKEQEEEIIRLKKRKTKKKESEVLK